MRPRSRSAHGEPGSQPGSPFGCVHFIRTAAGRPPLRPGRPSIVAKSQKQSRRDLIEKMQQDQARSDKRRTVIIVAASILVGLAIIAYPAIKLIQDSQVRNSAVSELGAKAGEASCDKVIDDKAAGTQDHQPDGTPIMYPVSPPSSGPHYATW